MLVIISQREKFNRLHESRIAMYPRLLIFMIISTMAIGLISSSISSDSYALKVKSVKLCEKSTLPTGLRRRPVVNWKPIVPPKRPLNIAPNVKQRPEVKIWDVLTHRLMLV